jgi:hypothetical protein
MPTETKTGIDSPGAMLPWDKAAIIGLAWAILAEAIIVLAGAILIGAGAIAETLWASRSQGAGPPATVLLTELGGIALGLGGLIALIITFVKRGEP